MHYLYVAHFSNGHIKVGRSTNPKARIAAHEDRVSCLGVELIEYHIAECIGHAAPAKNALIERCAAIAVKRNKSEWFHGLDYLDVCDWADELACTEYQFNKCVVLKLSEYLSVRGAQTNLANELGVDTQLVWQWTSGVRRIPAERCPAIEAATHGQVRCEDLRPDVNWGVLRGTAAPEQKEAA